MALKASRALQRPQAAAATASVTAPPGGTAQEEAAGGQPSSAALTDAVLLRCIADAHGLSDSSKKSYASALRSLVAKTAAVTTGAANPLVHLLLHDQDAKAAILAADVALRTKQMFAKALLSLYKHSTCVQQPALLAVRPAWEAFNSELCAQIDELVKSSTKSEREQAAWASLDEWLHAEARLAMTEGGSSRHLLVACHVKWPPLRGGDLGQVAIVPPGDARSTDGHSNVLCWAGTGQPAELRVQAHKTSHLRGSIVRPLPASLKAIVAASLVKQPRSALFVSPQTGAPFATEHAFTVWACRELHRVFGRPVTCNVARHAFISALDVARMSTRQLEDLAALMGHSARQQRAYHRVDDDTVQPDLVNSQGEYVLPLRVGAAAAPVGVDLAADAAFATAAPADA